MTKAYLIGGLRTPIGKKNGCFKNILPEKLAAAVLNGLLKKYALKPKNIDEVLAGNIIGPGGNIARVCLLEAGWPYFIPAFTIDAQCASGLTAIDTAAAFIESERADLIVAGGTESSSLAPDKRLHKNDPRYKGTDFFYEQAPFSPERIGNPAVGIAAENLAEKFNISRLEMDEFALSSHQKACAAQRDLSDIVLPMYINNKQIIKDEGPKNNMTMKLLARLKSPFKQSGRITAGNSCLKHDAAAFVLLASKNAVKKYSLKPQAIIYPAVKFGCDPKIFPLGPIYAIRKLLSDYKLSMDAVDAVEINEAFAMQILACCRELNLPLSKINQIGGAIAYGHPYGASGAIVLLHLLQTLKIKKLSTGIVSIGAVGGLSAAMLMQRM